MPNKKISTTVEIKADTRDIERVGRTVRDVFDPRTVEAFSKSVERATRSIQRLEQHSGGGRYARGGGRPAVMGRGEGASGGGGRAGAPAGGRGGGGPSAARTGFSAGFGGAVGGYIGSRAAQMSQMGGALGRGQGAVGQAAAAIPIVGQFMAGAIGEAESLYQAFLQREMAGAEAFGQTGVTTGQAGRFREKAAGLGLQGPQAMAQLAQISQQSGLQGKELTGRGGKAGIAGAALTQQRTLGVSGAPMIGAAGTAGGKVSEARGLMLMTTAIEAGFTAGFRGTRLDQFVQGVAQMTEQLRTEGIQVSPESIMSLVTGVSGVVGSSGEAGMRAAKTMAQSLRGISDKGGFGAIMAHRAAQELNREQGKAAPGLSEFEMIAEEKADELIPIMVKQMRESGGGKEAIAHLLKEVFPNLSARERRHAAGYRDPVEEKTDTDKAREEFLKTRLGGAPTAFKAPATAAGIAATREQVGGGELPGTEEIPLAVIEMQKLELEIVQEFVPAAAAFVRKGIEEFRRLKDIYDKEGLSGVMAEIFSGLAKALKDAVVKAFEGITDWIAEEFIPLMKQAFEQLATDVKEWISGGGPMKALTGENSDVNKRVLDQIKNHPKGEAPKFNIFGNPLETTTAEDPNGHSSLNPSEGAADKLAQASIILQGVSDDIRNLGRPGDVRA